MMGGGELVTLQLGCTGEELAPAFWDVQALLAGGGPPLDPAFFFEEGRERGGILRSRSVSVDLRGAGEASAGGDRGQRAPPPDSEEAAHATWRGSAVETFIAEASAPVCRSRLTTPALGAGAQVWTEGAWSGTAPVGRFYDGLALAAAARDAAENAVRLSFEACDRCQSLAVVLGSEPAWAGAAASLVPGLRDELGGALAIVALSSVPAPGGEGTGDGGGRPGTSPPRRDEERSPGGAPSARARGGEGSPGPSSPGGAATRASPLDDAMALSCLAPHCDALLRVRGPLARRPPSGAAAGALAAAALPWWTAPGTPGAAPLRDWARARLAGTPRSTLVDVWLGFRPRGGGPGDDVVRAWAGETAARLPDAAVSWLSPIDEIGASLSLADAREAVALGGFRAPIRVARDALALERGLPSGPLGPAWWAHGGGRGERARGNGGGFGGGRESATPAVPGPTRGPTPTPPARRPAASAWDSRADVAGLDEATGGALGPTSISEPCPRAAAAAPRPEPSMSVAGPGAPGARGEVLGALRALRQAARVPEVLELGDPAELEEILYGILEAGEGDGGFS